MKLAFIQAPAWGRDCPPYTMCFLAALIRQQGHQAYLYDFNNTLYHTSSCDMRKMWDDKDYYSYWEDKKTAGYLIESNKKIVDFYINKILASGIRVVGFTVHFSSAWASLEIAKRIKERDKDIVIIFGGPDCSRQQKGDFFIKQGCVDVVVTGEGEGPLFEIINSVDKLREIKAIKGCLLLRDGQVEDGGYAPGYQDLDSLPIPDYSDFRDDINSRMYREPRRLDIFDSRGCITCCHFCSEWQFWGKFRSKSGERIYEEVLRHMENFPQVNYFYFIGSLINGNIQVLEKFCDLIIDNNLKIQWAGQAVIRPEMNKELLKKMKRAGCAWISYGIESGSQKVLAGMNKKFNLDAASKVLCATKEAQIDTQVNFMFGLPGETRDDFNQTLAFLKDNRKYFDTILASQSFCVIDKGTYLYNHPEEFGIKGRGHHLYWEADNGKNNYPERFRRYEEFCRLALSLGIPETSGVLKNKPDKWRLLGDYYFYKRDFKSAIENYLKASIAEPKNSLISNKLNQCYEEAQPYPPSYLKEASSGASEIVIGRQAGENIISLSPLPSRERLGEGEEKLKPPLSDRLYEIEDWNSIESKELAKILKYFSATGYKDVDLEKIISDSKFSEKQKSMSRALYSHGLWIKLSNYILADVQKARKDIFLYGYPYWLVADPCNYCNLQCPFCPTGQKRNVRVKGELKLEDFKNIIAKLGPYLIHIDLVNWGEPLLNENIFEMVRYAKQYGMDIKMDTNLSFLDEKEAKKLVLSGLDKIVVSLDGLTEESYVKYRRGGNFKAVMDNLKLLLKARKELNSKKPYITWQFLVFRHNEHEIEEVRRMGKKLGVDHVGITNAFIGDKDWIPLNPAYSNYNTEKMDNGDLTYEHFKIREERFCNWPWEAIAINTNGAVSVCCSVEEEKDDFSNILEQPFEELWNSPEYLTARTHIFKKKQFSPNSKNICVNCRHLGLINIDILSCHSFFD